LSEEVVFEELDYEEYTKILQENESAICYSLNLEHSPIQELSSKITVINRINLSNCLYLTKLPEYIDCHQLNLTNCTALTSLPKGICVSSLIISGCTGITELPEDMVVEHMEFVARDCINLKSLKGMFFNLTKLDLQGCSLIGELPDDIDVNYWIDIGGTRIQKLPETLRHIQFQWNGIPLDEKTAFNPEQLTPQNVLGEINAEKRRVMILRMGYERFFKLSKPAIIDEDEDLGGLRQLLGIRLFNDEDIVALSVSCPSTGRKYVIRVPPQMRSCHQAAAWIAGFDNPNDYQPIRET
jgi:hypothetical protein